MLENEVIVEVVEIVGGRCAAEMAKGAIVSLAMVGGRQGWRGGGGRRRRRWFRRAGGEFGSAAAAAAVARGKRGRLQ